MGRKRAPAALLAAGAVLVWGAVALAAQAGQPPPSGQAGQGQQSQAYEGTPTFNQEDYDTLVKQTKKPEKTGGLTESDKSWLERKISEVATSATKRFIQTALSPGTAEIALLRMLTTERIPPGSVGAVKRAWTGFWWGSVAVLLIATIVQAIRIATAGDGGPDPEGRNRWMSWLAAPLIGALMARLSLFVVDLTVTVQNAMWQDTLSSVDPCALVYGGCGADAITGGELAGAIVSLMMWILNMIAAGLFTMLYSFNWIALAGLAVIGPAYFAFTAAGRTPVPIAGWLGLVARTTAMQSITGLGLAIILSFREAAQEATGPMAAFLNAMDTSGFIRFAVTLSLILILIFWWFLPMLAAGWDLVTLRGGETLESVGRFGTVVGGILTGVGVMTGNPGLIAAGQRTAMAGAAAAMAGGVARQRAEAARQARTEQGIGGWIAKRFETDPMGEAEGVFRDAAGRAAAGLPPSAPYRVRASGALPPGRVEVSAAPGLATAVIRGLADRDMDVEMGDQEFLVDATDEAEVGLFWEVAGQAVTGGKVPLVRKVGSRFYTFRLDRQTLDAVAAHLQAANVDYQDHGNSVSVAKSPLPLQVAVARALLDHRVGPDGKLRFRLGRLDSRRAAEVLSAADRADVRVVADGDRLVVRARLRGDKAGDRTAAARAAREALADAEREALRDRPAYYRHGDKWLVFEREKPMRVSDTPPPDGIFLGDWLGRT